MTTWLRPPSDGAGTARLEARRLSVAYRHGPRVLSDIDFQVSPGQRVAVLGANGLGKSTLLQCLSGALKPSAGGVFLDGAELRFDRASLNTHRRHVQLVLQDPDDQLFGASVEQDVSFGPLNLGMESHRVRSAVEEALDVMDLGACAERPVHELSYGQKKRVAIAGAVAMRPSVLLLDEPTAGLDPAGTARMMSALGRLESNGTSIMLATHEVDLAWQWADAVAVVQSGGTVTQAPAVAALSSEERIEDAHLARPWPVELLERLGIPFDHADPPRTVAAVARHIAARQPKTATDPI